MSENKAPEFMPVHSQDRREVPGCIDQIPMNMLDENQALRNHSQTLKRLAERGGLGLKEALAVADKKPYRDILLTDLEALAEWKRRLHKKEGEASIPEEMPKMGFELAALSDVAAIEYGNQNSRLIPAGTCNDYDTGTDITEAHEQGQMWMYHKLQEEISQVVENATAYNRLSVEQENKIITLQSQLSSITEELRIARKNVDGLTHWWSQAKAERDAALKEVAEMKEEIREYRKALNPGTSIATQIEISDKYKKEEQK